MNKSVVRITLLLALVVAIGVISGATSNMRQVGGFTAQLPPQEPQTPQTAVPTLPPGHRHIFSHPGAVTPITAQLAPEDKIVEVLDPSIPMSYSDQVAGAEEELGTLMTFPAVAVIDVTQKESAFDSGDAWIWSTLTVHVREVHKDSTGQLVAGNSIQVTENGGEVVLPDGRRIIARRNYLRLSRAGGTYLAALTFSEGRFFLVGMFSFEFDNGEVKRMRLGTPPDAGLEQKTAEWATQRARAIAERRSR